MYVYDVVCVQCIYIRVHHAILFCIYRALREVHDCAKFWYVAHSICSMT